MKIGFLPNVTRSSKLWAPRGMRLGSEEGSKMRNFIFCSFHLIRVILSRRLRWAIHATKMEEHRGDFKILTDNPTGKRP